MVVAVTVNAGYYAFFLNWLHFASRHIEVPSCLAAIAEHEASTFAEVASVEADATCERMAARVASMAELHACECVRARAHVCARACVCVCVCVFV